MTNPTPSTSAERGQLPAGATPWGAPQTTGFPPWYQHVDAIPGPPGQADVPGSLLFAASSNWILNQLGYLADQAGVVPDAGNNDDLYRSVKHVAEASATASIDGPVQTIQL